MAFHLSRRYQRLQSNPSLIRCFSNSSSEPPPRNLNASVDKSSVSPSDSSSPFSDIKTTLKQKLQNQEEKGRSSFDRSVSQSQNVGSSRFSANQSRMSLQDLGKNLANFQRRSTVPPPRNSGGVESRPQISLEALYKQNRNTQSFNSNAVWDNLKNLRTQINTSSNMSKNGGFLGNFKSTGGGALSMSMFETDTDQRKGKEGETEEMMTDFLMFYNEEELGEKLRMLRPEGDKEEGWFSLQELNQRLVKLRQVEEKEAQSRTKKDFVGLRNVISSIKNVNDKSEVLCKQSQAIMGLLGGVAEYKLHPPKEELVETYFHPDNMSSAEKMKIKLTEVREEFKMSESDCGSARVQVAQLTTKIKHLSSALHKKDKHSRKGLLGMVQKRKKLLKYLRRTDWDSYCLVLSKLGLRDNPDYKF